MSPVPSGKKYLLIYVFVLLIFDSLRGPRGSSYHVQHMNFNSLLWVHGLATSVRSLWHLFSLRLKLLLNCFWLLWRSNHLSKSDLMARPAQSSADHVFEKQLNEALQLNQLYNPNCKGITADESHRICTDIQNIQREESAQHKAKKKELKKARKCSLNVSFQPETEPPAAAGEAEAASGASEAAWIWPYDNGLCDHKCDCFCGECCGLPRYHDHGNPERHLCKLHMQDSEDYGNARHMWIKYRDPAPPQRCWWCPPIGSKEAWFYETDPRSGWLQFRDPQSNCLWWWSWRNGDFFLEPGRRWALFLCAQNKTSVHMNDTGDVRLHQDSAGWGWYYWIHALISFYADCDDCDGKTKMTSEKANNSVHDLDEQHIAV